MPFIDEIATAACLHAEYQGMKFAASPVDPTLVVIADQQLLASAVMNLLQNAFKYSHRDSLITLKTHSENDRVLIDIEDECGGLGRNDPKMFQAFGDRRENDRSGPGLGLSISRRAIQANGGDIHCRMYQAKAASSPSTCRPWSNHPYERPDNPCDYLT